MAEKGEPSDSQHITTIKPKEVSKMGESLSSNGNTGLAERTTCEGTDNKDSDEVVERYCEPCHGEGVSETATYFCYTCLDYICSTCQRYHNRYLPDHQHVDIDKISPDTFFEHCSRHKNKLIKLYCVSCKSFLCSDCQQKTHQGKGKCVIRRLAEVVEGHEVQAEVKDVVSKGNSFAKRLSGTKKSLDTKQEKLSESQCEIKKEIEDCYSKISQDLHTVEEKISSENTSKNERIRVLKEKTDSLKSKIGKMSDAFKQPTHQKYKPFMELKRVRLEIGTLEASLEELDKEYSTKNDKLKAELKHGVNEIHENMKKTVLRTGIECGSSEQKQKERRKVAAPIADINVKTDSDSEDCVIVHICLLSEQYIVVCDQNNLSLKVLDTKNQCIVHVRSLKTCPVATTKVNNKEIAIVQGHEHDGDRSIIGFLTFTQSRSLTFQRKRAIYPDMLCTDIIYYRDTLIVSMTDHYKGQIQVLSMRGSILFSLGEDEAGNKLFTIPYYLAIDPVRRRLYVSDICNDAIIETKCNNLESARVAKTYWKPRGLTVDKDGVVYLCEFGTNRIYAFHPDTCNTYVLIGNHSSSFKPRSVCYSEIDGKLYAGQVNCNHIKVYAINKKEFIKSEVLEKVEKWIPS